jgi:eukaryotic-like serine/threonine-protein kinase
MLRDVLDRSPHDRDRRLRASLALLAQDPGQVAYLSDRFVDASPAELAVLCDFLQGHGTALCPRLWSILEANGPDNSRVLGPAGALARFDHKSPRWQGCAAKVAGAMVSVNPIHVSEWLAIFRPVKEPLRAALFSILRKKGQDETDRMHAMNYLVDYSSESPGELVGLLQEAGAKEFALVFPEIDGRRQESLPLLERAIRDDPESPPRGEAEKDRRAERQAKAAVALFRLGAVDPVWPLLVHGSDPRLRSFLIHWLARLGDDPHTFEACLARIASAPHAQPDAPAARAQPAIDPNRSELFDADASTRRAVVLIVGHFDLAHLAAEGREGAIRTLLDLYRDDPDPGVHGAARWALDRWQQNQRLRQIDFELSRVKETGSRRWSVNSSGQTMVHIDGPLKFRMGVPGNDQNFQNEPAHQRRIPRRFAIAATEVSIGEFAEFWKNHSAEFPKPDLSFGSGEDPPRSGVTWYMAAAYCNWLSAKEGKEPVYAVNADGKFAEGMRVKAEAFDKGGYRLPTEAEWEYACRAGTETSRYFGHSVGLLREYAWFRPWEESSLLSRGSLLPNDFGLFDMLGNLMEWCHDADYDYNEFASEAKSDYIFKEVISSRYYVMRGGSFDSRPPDAQSGVRVRYEPGLSHFTIGFRVARSLPF